MPLCSCLSWNCISIVFRKWISEEFICSTLSSADRCLSGKGPLICPPIACCWFGNCWFINCWFGDCWFEGRSDDCWSVGLIDKSLRCNVVKNPSTLMEFTSKKLLCISNSAQTFRAAVAKPSLSESQYEKSRKEDSKVKVAGSLCSTNLRSRRKTSLQQSATRRRNN